jgi:hypothetical protein
MMSIDETLIDPQLLEIIQPPFKKRPVFNLHQALRDLIRQRTKSRSQPPRK